VTPLLRRAGAGFRLRRDDLEDAIQNTWLQAFTHLDRLREPEALVAWLVVTMRREALRSLQTVTREVLTDAVDCNEADPLTVEDIVLRREREAAVRSAVERLPQRQRSLLERMIAAPGARYGELATQLEMPIGSIGPTRERALTRLRDDGGLADISA
jgi:RNA polymerase sigma factor (sigma-70 family)